MNSSDDFTDAPAPADLLAVAASTEGTSPAPAPAAPAAPAAAGDEAPRPNLRLLKEQRHRERINWTLIDALHKHSPTWLHFKLYDPSYNIKHTGVCMHCLNRSKASTVIYPWEVKMGNKNSTSKLDFHLARHHPTVKSDAVVQAMLMSSSDEEEVDGAEVKRRRVMMTMMDPTPAPVLAPVPVPAAAASEGMQVDELATAEPSAAAATEPEQAVTLAAATVAEEAKETDPSASSAAPTASKKKTSSSILSVASLLSTPNRMQKKFNKKELAAARLNALEASVKTIEQRPQHRASALDLLLSKPSEGAILAFCTDLLKQDWLKSVGDDDLKRRAFRAALVKDPKLAVEFMTLDERDMLHFIETVIEQQHVV